MENNTTSSDVSTLSLQDFALRLAETVSQQNAQLLLKSALIDCGWTDMSDRKLNREEAKTLCLELIKRGGPAFRVGKAIYQEAKLH